MRILIVSQYFPPETGAAASRIGDFSKELIQLGHQVTIITEKPNYPIGKVYPEYKEKWTTVETPEENLKIYRTWVWISSRNNFFQRIGFYLSFFFASIIKSFKISSPDVVICTSPPLFVGAAGWIISKIHSTPFVLDIRDLWPESAIKLGELKNRILIRLSFWLERYLYRKSAFITVAVPGFCEVIHRSENHPVCIELPNGVSEEFLSQSCTQQSSGSEHFTVLYSGNMGLAQGLETLIEAADILQDKKDIQFRLVGDGVEKAKLMSLASSLNNIDFEASCPRKQLVRRILAADLCVVPLRDDPLFMRALPSKMFEYMALGRPMVVTIDGEARKLIETNDTGVYVPPGDARELANTILQLKNDQVKLQYLGQNGTELVRKQYMKKDIIKNLDNALRDLL